MPMRQAFASMLILAAAVLAAALDSPLSSGVPFPDLVGKALSGSDITVGMRDGQAKVIVMTFTRAAANPAQAWLDACRADETAQVSAKSASVGCYDVRMAQDIPRIVRGFIEGRMKKDLKPEHLSKVVLIYKDKEAWRDRLMVMHDNEDQPFIIMVDREGRVQSLLQGAFNPGALTAEQAKLVAK